MDGVWDLDNNNLLLEAIKLLGARKNLAKLLGISRQRLNGWLNDYKSMGYEYAIAIEYLTCGKIKAEDLLPQKAMILKSLDLTATFSCSKSSPSKIVPQLIEK